MSTITNPHVPSLAHVALELAETIAWLYPELCHKNTDCRVGKEDDADLCCGTCHEVGCIRLKFRNAQTSLKAAGEGSITNLPWK